MKYELAIFDLDGTLVDTIDDLGAAVNHALSLRGLPLHGREEYRLMVGNGVRNLVHRAMPEELKGDTGLLDALLADFISWYSCHLDVRSRPYPGIPELLAAGAKHIAMVTEITQAPDVEARVRELRTLFNR